MKNIKLMLLLLVSIAGIGLLSRALADVPQSASLPTIYGKPFHELNIIGGEPLIHVQQSVDDQGRAWINIWMDRDAEDAIQRLVEERKKNHPPVNGGFIPVVPGKKK